jgi:predicted Fe-Mo cluster-binding NifX family protein
MAAELADCDVLVAGGMGRGAYESFLRAGLEVVLTDLRDINDVVNAWMNGTLRNLAEERTH